MPRWLRGVKLGLYPKILAAFLIVGVLPIAMSWVWLNAVPRKALAANVEDNLQHLALRVSTEVSGILSQGKVHIRFLANNPVVASETTGIAEKLQEMQWMQEVYGLFEDITLVDLEGRVLASTTYNYRGEWRNKEAFQQAKQGKVATSDAHIALEKVVMLFAAPLTGEETWGVIAGQMNLDRIWKVVDGVKVSERGYAFLLNGAGRLIAYPKKGQLFERWGAEGLINEVLSTTGGTVTGSTQGAPPSLYAYSAIANSPGGPSNYWRLVISLPLAEAYGVAASMLRGLGVALIIISAAVVGVSLFITRRVVGPLQALVEATRRVTEGDLDYQVPAATKDEIGDLASSFNAMTQELRARIQELEQSRRRIVAAEERVRKGVADRLHGPVQTQLWMLEQELQESQGLVKSDPEKAHALLSEVRHKLGLIREKDLREISRDLHPAILNLGLPAALRSLQDRFEGVIDFELHISEEVLDGPTQPSLPREVRLALYRFAQEAITNVIKHAGATRVRVSLWQPNPKRVSLSVEDNGVGFVAEEVEPGLGMASMWDHIAALGGSHSFESAPGKGTRVAATCPLPSPQSPGPKGLSTSPP